MRASSPLFVGLDAPQRVGCNDHSRRRFVQALEHCDRHAQPMIDRYRDLYHVERTATERSLDATGRRALRQAESVPLWLELARVILTSRHARSRQEISARQGPLLLDSTAVDSARIPRRRSIPDLQRPCRATAQSRVHVSQKLVVRRQPRAGERYANLFTILLACELAGVNPYVYLVDVGRGDRALRT
jgi:Transposase IS66 family